jgi:DNA-binding transcriptional LysR family regulator
MQVDMHLTNRSLDLVAEGLDMAIRLGALEDSSMIARKLAARRLFVCAAPAYIAARGQPHSLSELAQHHCLLGTLDYWRFQENGKNHTRKVHGRLRCNSGHALLHAALNGTGIVQLPDYYVADHLASGALVPMLTAFQPAEEGIWAIYPPSRHMSAKVRTTIDYLAQHLSTPVIPPKTTAACQFCTL